jgi:hypothetical protein
VRYAYDIVIVIRPFTHRLVGALPPMTGLSVPSLIIPMMLPAYAPFRSARVQPLLNPSELVKLTYVAPCDIPDVLSKSAMYGPVPASVLAGVPAVTFSVCCGYACSSSVVRKVLSITLPTIDNFTTFWGIVLIHGPHGYGVGVAIVRVGAAVGAGVGVAIAAAGVGAGVAVGTGVAVGSGTGVAVGVGDVQPLNARATSNTINIVMITGAFICFIAIYLNCYTIV